MTNGRLHNINIAKNHTLDAVHAWFAAFLCLTRESLTEIAQF